PNDETCQKLIIAQWKPARGSRLFQPIVPSWDSADPEMFSKRRPPLTVRRDATAKVSPRNAAIERWRQFDFSNGSVKSQIRAGSPLTSSPTRPANTDCVVVLPPARSTPAATVCAPADLVSRAPIDQVRSVPTPGSMIEGTGPSERRSRITDPGAVRSVVRFPRL